MSIATADRIAARFFDGNQLSVTLLHIPYSNDTLELSDNGRSPEKHGRKPSAQVRLPADSFPHKFFLGFV
jgi:hypothetical protein